MDDSVFVDIREVVRRMVKVTSAARAQLDRVESGLIIVPRHKRKG